ncbi:MAG TPA: ATP-binding protein [Aliidongia sp.]|nr:ATP-binding protein [Aliidongia sp.]
MANGDHTTAIFDLLDDGLTLWDRDDRFVLGSDRCRDLLGATLTPGMSWQAAVEGFDAAGLFTVKLATAPDLLAEAAKGGLDLDCADGRRLRLIERANEAGRLRLFRDITEEKRRERDLLEWLGYLDEQIRDLDRLTIELSEAKQLAEAANFAKSAFLTGMSHELRTPLNAVLGFAEIVRDQVFGRHEIDRYSNYAADIHSSGLHLLTLINDILDLSKIEAGKMELREEITDLESIIASAFNLVQEAALRGGINLRRLTRERIALRADGTKLKQCLLNLLANAVKFTPSGGSVTLSVNLDASHLMLGVQDTGIGIAPDDIPGVFEPFRQIDGEISRKSHGTGLGIPLTKRFMELHGGTVAIESELGRGTLATLLLPIDRVVAQEGWDDDIASMEKQG